jgi:hypothetical protein
VTFIPSGKKAISVFDDGKPPFFQNRPILLRTIGKPIIQLICSHHHSDPEISKRLKRLRRLKTQRNTWRRKESRPRPFSQPIHALPPYRSNLALRIAEEISAVGLDLPSSTRLTEGQIEEVAHALKGAMLKLAV